MMRSVRSHASYGLLPILLVGALVASSDSHSAPIRFVAQTIPFQLDGGETPARNAPETMPGGVAILDYNRDGRPDIFSAEKRSAVP